MTARIVTRHALRPATPADSGLLFAIFASTREEELAATGWSEAEKGEFLRVQSRAQEADYRAKPGATFHVITCDGEDVGRLYLRDEPGTLHVVDIALLAPWRGRGIGTEVIAALMAEARERGLGVSLYVERWNPARYLYERLGFAVVDDGDVYLRMEWLAA